MGLPFRFFKTIVKIIIKVLNNENFKVKPWNLTITCKL